MARQGQSPFPRHNRERELKALTKIRELEDEIQRLRVANHKGEELPMTSDNELKVLDFDDPEVHRQFLEHLKEKGIGLSPRPEEVEAAEAEAGKWQAKADHYRQALEEIAKGTGKYGKLAKDTLEA